MKFCVYTICKNEFNNLKKWLNCMKEADYMVLLDTGSTDGTWEYLMKVQKLYSNLIIKQKKYKNFRFDIARNDSLKLIPKDADFCIMLDIDETFEEEGWIIELKKWWRNNYTSGFLPYSENNRYFLKDKKRFGIVQRIHNRECYWKYPVFEYITGDNINTNNCVIPSVKKLIVHHNNNTISDNRNIYKSLAKLRIEETDDIIGYSIYTFESKEITKEWEKKILDKINTENNVWVSGLCLSLALHYEKSHKKDLAEQMYEKGMKLNKNDHFLYYYAAVFYLNNNEINKSKKIAADALEKMDFLNNSIDETYTFIKNTFEDILKNK